LSLDCPTIGCPGSKDHIVVQAASDFNVLWRVAKSLSEILSNHRRHDPGRDRIVQNDKFLLPFGIRLGQLRQCLGHEDSNPIALMRRESKQPWWISAPRRSFPLPLLSQVDG